MASSSLSATSTKEVAVVPTSNTQPQSIFDFKAYLDRKIYYNKMLLDTGVRLPLGIMYGMSKTGILDSFQKILEDQKRENNAIIAKIEADYKNKCAHLYDASNSDDDKEEEGDDDEKQSNVHGTIETPMKRQKISHTDASTQTTSE